MLHLEMFLAENYERKIILREKSKISRRLHIKKKKEKILENKSWNSQLQIQNREKNLSNR